jgi:hypothetical protein
MEERCGSIEGRCGLSNVLLAWLNNKKRGYHSLLCDTVRFHDPLSSVESLLSELLDIRLSSGIVYDRIFIRILCLGLPVG